MKYFFASVFLPCMATQGFKDYLRICPILVTKSTRSNKAIEESNSVDGVQLSPSVKFLFVFQCFWLDSLVLALFLSCLFKT